MTSWISLAGPMTSRAFSTSRTLSSDSELASIFSEECTDCMRLFRRRCGWRSSVRQVSILPSFSEMEDTRFSIRFVISKGGS